MSLCFDQDAVGDDIKCDVQASAAYDVITVRLSSSRGPCCVVTTQLTYSELDHYLPSQVTLSFGLLFCLTNIIHFISSL